MTIHRATDSGSKGPLDAFEQSLLTELRHHVAERSGASAPRPGRVRRRLAVLAAAAVAGGSVALGAAVLRPDAAFAVVEEGDGDIVVTITSLEDADGLEAALAEHGVEADVAYDPSGPVVDSPEDQPGHGVGAGVGAEVDQAVSPPAGEEQEPCGLIGVEIDDDAITFRLPAEAVDAKSPLHVRTAGDSLGRGMVTIAWESPVC